MPYEMGARSQQLITKSFHLHFHLAPSHPSTSVNFTSPSFPATPSRSTPPPPFQSTCFTLHPTGCRRAYHCFKWTTQPTHILDIPLHPLLLFLIFSSMALYVPIHSTTPGDHLRKQSPRIPLLLMFIVATNWYKCRFRSRQEATQWCHNNYYRKYKLYPVSYWLYTSHNYLRPSFE